MTTGRIRRLLLGTNEPDQDRRKSFGSNRFECRSYALNHLLFRTTGTSGEQSVDGINHDKVGLILDDVIAESADIIRQSHRNYSIA